MKLQPIIFLLFVLILSSLASARLSDDIKVDEKDIKANEIYREVGAIKYQFREKDILLSDGQTIYQKDDNTAFALKNDKEIDIYGFKAKSGENIIVDTYGKSSVFCLSFPESTDKVDLLSIKMNGADVRGFILKEPYKYCIRGIDVSNKTFVYKLNLKGYKMKYNIEFNDTVLDPFIYGNLYQNNLLALYVPFNNSINAAWASKANALSSANTRFNDTEEVITELSTASNPSYYHDQNWGTAATIVTAADSGLADTYEFRFIKSAIDTGMLLQVKDGLYENGAGTCSAANQGIKNLTVTNSCFTASANSVQFKVTSSFNSVGVEYGDINYYCLGGSGFELIGNVHLTDCAGTKNYEFYEVGVFITNQSNYTAYSQVNITNYYYNNNLIAQPTYARDVALNINNSIYLNGSAYINVTNASLNNVTLDRSVCMWLKPNSTASATKKAIFSYGSNQSGKGYELYLNETTNRLYLSDFSQNIVSTELINNSWSSVCVVSWNSSVNMYKNGVLANTTTYTLNTTSNKTLIGTSIDRLNEYYTGYLDDFAFYNTLLSSNEINVLYLSKLNTTTVRNIVLIDERNNVDFTDFDNLTSIRVYYDDNSTYYDFKQTEVSNVTLYIASNQTKLRFEYVYPAGDIVTRYVDTGADNDSTLRVCINPYGVTHRQNIVTSPTVDLVKIVNVYSNCLVGKDYTRFSYETYYNLPIYLIDAEYYLYKYNGTAYVNLAGLDGSISTSYDLGTLEFKQRVYPVNLYAQGIGVETNGSTLIITYSATQTDYTRSDLYLINTNGSVSLYNFTELVTPSNFYVVFNYSNVTATDLLKVRIESIESDGSVSSITRYITIKGSVGVIHPGLAFAISVLMVIFGLTLVASNYAFSFIGLVIVGGAIAILSMGVWVWYSLILLAAEIIILVYIGIQNFVLNQGVLT